MRIFHLLLLVLIANLFLFTKASDASQLSNDQKKEVVYKKYSDYKKEFPAVKEISPQQAMELFIQGELLFVDARKPAEMEVSMLPGAISSEIFLADPEKYKDKTIVIYCTISKRSGLLAREMSRKGITATNLKGGLLAWLL